MSRADAYPANLPAGVSAAIPDPGPVGGFSRHPPPSVRAGASWSRCRARNGTEEPLSCPQSCHLGARGPCRLVLWRPTPAWEGSQHLAQALLGRAGLQL